MGNKTCGDCCGFSESENRCLLLGGRGKTYADNEACRRFSEKKPIPPLTNGKSAKQTDLYCKDGKESEGKMSKEQTIKVHDPIFRQTFLLYCNYEFSVFYKEVLGEDYSGDCGVVSGYCINTDQSEICIWLKDYNDIPSLIHELQHAMQYALYERCFVDRREAELPAYYMEFLSREFLCKYKEIGNNNEN